MHVTRLNNEFELNKQTKAKLLGFPPSYRTPCTLRINDNKSPKGSGVLELETEI